jgi:hypothetical protein
LNEVSDNLTNWRYNDDGFFEDATAELSRIDNGDGTETITVYDKTPLGEDLDRFIRLNVSVLN